MTTATLARPNAVPKGGGNGRAIALALLMHALLGGLLFFGIRWQSSPTEVIQAELWSATPQTAAPAPRPVPPPQRVEPPAPEPKATPEPPLPNADIVEKVPAKVEPPKKREPVKVETPKKVEPARVDPPKKVEPAKVEPQKTPPKPVVEAPARPPSDLAAIMAAATEGTGQHQQTSGPRGGDRSGYTAKLIAAIRSQMRYPASAPGNPFVTARVEQLPTGDVVNVTIVKSSGVPAFDDAVERAIRAASPLPRDDRGPFERVLTPTYYMYDK